MHPALQRRFLTDLSTSLFSFVLPLLPTTEELSIKEEVRTLIEKLIKTIEPSSRLLSFGSSCNSFGLRNSDMDLVCLIDQKEDNLHPADFVAMIGDLLERETNFDVKPLPKARIPIIKLSLKPSPGLPYGIACDIGFENRLAIENTRLLLTYATIDPARVRTLVLFLKVWAKRRKINSPYRGTLSSYGITLMVLYYLVHVKNPPVLPNLQRIAPLRPMSKEETTLEGRDIWFFDDTETLRQEWSSANFESVGELLIDFFRYFSHDFQFNNSVLSIRAGQLTKESKGWMNDIDVGGLNENARDRNRLCIEDPFETSYNVARTVTKDGLYTIRGEFMRATRILTQRPERAVHALAELCVEREEELARAPRSSSPAPRNLSTGRSPFPVGSGWRSSSQAPHDRLSPALMPGDAHDEFARRPLPSHMGRRDGSGMNDYQPSAQEMWLANQGLGLDFALPAAVAAMGVPGAAYGDGLRGRDTSTRHLDGFEASSGGGSGRRAQSHVEGGSGSISVPLSPVRPYAQIEGSRAASGTWSASVSPRHAAGKPQQAPYFDPRHYASHGLPVRRASGSQTAGSATGYRRSNPNMGSSSATFAQSQSQYSSNSRQQSPTNAARRNLNPPGQSSDPFSGETSPLPTFAPFASPMPAKRPLGAGSGNGSAATFISPSALLSPPPQHAAPPAFGGYANNWPSGDPNGNETFKGETDEVVHSLGQLGLESTSKPASPRKVTTDLNEGSSPVKRSNARQLDSAAVSPVGSKKTAS